MSTAAYGLSAMCLLGGCLHDLHVMWTATHAGAVVVSRPDGSAGGTISAIVDGAVPFARQQFDWGDVHFVGLDTQDLADEQTLWLDRDLASTKARWKVAYLHRPPLSSGQHGTQADVRKRFVGLFEKHHVQLVLAGHDHDYERTRPQHGVTYVVTGGGGRSTRAVSSSSFTAFSLAVLHFLYVEADDAAMTVHAIDATGAEFDSVVIRPTS